MRVFYLLLFSVSFIFAQEKIVLTTHNLSPYGFYKEGEEVKVIADSTFQGPAVELVRDIMKRMNIELEIQVWPWERAQALVIDGLADGFICASQKDSRDNFAVMSEIIADQNWNWYLLEENPLDPNSKSFKEDAIVSGYIGSNMLKYMIENNYRIKGTPNTTENLLSMLLAKRIDAVMANNYVMAELIIKNNVQRLIKTYTFMEKPLGVYFSKEFLKKYPNFLNEFNKYVLEYKNN